MDKPEIAGKTPKEVDLVEGKTYFFCACGRSKNQPFCDGSHSGTPFTAHSFTADKTGKAWLCMCKHTKNKPFCDGSHSNL